MPPRPAPRTRPLTREGWLRLLGRKGAHTTAVGEVRRGGKDVRAIVAHFARRPKGIPTSVPVRSGSRVVEMPVVVRVVAAPGPET